MHCFLFYLGLCFSLNLSFTFYIALYNCIKRKCKKANYTREPTYAKVAQLKCNLSTLHSISLIAYKNNLQIRKGCEVYVGYYKKECKVFGVQG